LLPVGYFHLVFTVPARIADIAYQNKRVLYDLLMRASAKANSTAAKRRPRNLHISGSSSRAVPCRAPADRSVVGI
jgi:hypothetical protein